MLANICENLQLTIPIKGLSPPKPHRKLFYDNFILQVCNTVENLNIFFKTGMKTALYANRFTENDFPLTIFVLIHKQSKTFKTHLIHLPG